MKPIILCDRCKDALQPRHGSEQQELLTRISSVINRFPSESQLRLLPTMKSDIEHDILRFDKEISRLTDVLSELQTQRARLQRQVTSCSSLLAPIRRLPPELLVEIFSFSCVLPSNDLTQRKISAPYNISHVCSYWRELSISTPNLWSRISVDLDFATDDTPKVVEMFLKRSFRRPLTLIISDSLGYDQLFKVMNALMTERHRFYKVELQGWLCTFDLPYERAYMPQDNVFPTLEYLILKAGWESYNCTFFQTRAPNLHTVTLEDISQGGPINLPDSVTSIDISDGLSSFVLFQASRYVGIRHASLTYAENGNGDLGAHSLPNWVSLKVTYAGSFLDEHPFDSLFDAMTLPSLEELSIASRDRIGLEWPHDAFRRMLVRSQGFKLWRLNLAHFDLSPAGLVEVMKLLPSLTHIGIHEPRNTPYPSVDHEVLLQMSQTPTNPLQRILPKLVDISITFATSLNVHEPLLRFVQSRSDLESVRISYLKNPHAATVRELREIRRPGLDLRVDLSQVEDEESLNILPFQVCV